MAQTQTRTQRTGWAGGTRYQPTLGELVESSAAAVAVVRDRLAEGETTEGQLLLVERTAAHWHALAERFGAQTKACRISGKQSAETVVGAFVAGRR